MGRGLARPMLERTTMANHELGMTTRIDAPTVAFRDQPTASFPNARFARDLFEQSSTGSTLRPVVNAAIRSELPTVLVARPPAKTRTAWALCIVGLCIGIVAGHVVREGRGYADRASATMSSLRSSKGARAASPRTAEIVAASFGGTSLSRDAATLETRGAASSVPKKERRPPKNAARPVASAAPRAAADALFVDFEPTFRAPR